ncbi:hypothetical protein [Halobacterium jilantaiense]|uniref:Uncharacterized protein n=1 Tax=Halobacterium jilantaiense TaxID=355548 RepID=A0A1I0PD10_9EURY|nr:hypothetical protein [Halobacterium jilantaiense]SEW11494.1 hypothetical protein SAMN04487945_1550 [Halobacterium jilantaiense]
MSPTPSRRRFLALCAAGSSVALAGCQSETPSTETTRKPPEKTDDPPTGLVWQKEVAVELSRADPPTRTDLLRLKYDDREPGAGTVSGSFDPAYLDGAVNGASVTVSESHHDTLTTEFGDVTYMIYMGPVNDAGDHLHVPSRRAEFNDIPLAGTAAVETFRVRESEDDRGEEYARPIATSGPSEPPADVDVRQFDLGARFDADY